MVNQIKINSGRMIVSKSGLAWFSSGLVKIDNKIHNLLYTKPINQYIKIYTCNKNKNVYVRLCTIHTQVVFFIFLYSIVLKNWFSGLVSRPMMNMVNQAKPKRLTDIVRVWFSGLDSTQWW